MPRKEGFLQSSGVLGFVLIASVGLALPPGQKKSVDITVSAGPNPTITLSQDPIALKKNQHFAEWKLVSGQGYDFEVEIVGPGERPPKKLLPKPDCSGTGQKKACRTIIPDTDDYYGDHEYKLIVHTPGKDTVLDPRVSVDA